MALIIEALQTAFGTIATNFNAALQDILPLALGIMGVSMVVVLGVKTFKRIATK